MAVMQMQRLNLCGHKRSRKAILERLQTSGVVEIDMHGDVQEGTQTMDTTGEKAAFERNASAAEQALGILNIYAPEKKSLLSSLEGKKQISKQDFEQLVLKRDKTLAEVKEILRLDKSIAEARSEIARLENRMEALEPWMPLDVPLNTQGTKQTVVLFGTLNGQVSLEQIYTALKTAEQPVETCEVTIVSSTKDYTYISAVMIRTMQDAFQNALRGLGYARPAEYIANIPAKEKELLEQSKETQLQFIRECEGELAARGPLRGDIEMIQDYFSTRAEKYSVLGKLPQTGHAFFLSGYVPKEKAGALVKDLEENYGATVELEEIPENEEIPVLLKNNPFSNSVEGVLASYGLPKRGEIDPTTIMSFFYVFLFGLMLSDAAYGALIAIACGVVLLKFKNMDQGLYKSIKMFFWCGVSTLFWGVMFGGYFGDLITVVSREYFGHAVEIPALWFVPLNEPMRMLMYSMVFGLIHLFTGLALAGYLKLKKKDFVGFFCDVVAWFMFLIGLILILLPTEIFHSISQMEFNFPAGLNLFAKVLAIAGAVIILVMSGRRKKKKIGMRLAIGAYDLYGITSWLSDILSYSRLLALGLATGVIAQVINQMGTMFGTGVFGTIVFILIFIIGHTLNLAINLLGAYVHTNRLQFVEFFNKFYEGGGKPFQPFTTITKYIKIKEEN